MKKTENRIGEIRRNKDTLGGYKMKIIEYNNSKNVIIEFQDDYKAIIHTNYTNFLNGNIKNPYHPIVYNIGYVGQGEYSKTTHLKIYQTWQDMIRRCYNEKEREKSPTYEECIVEKYFHCFQNYAKWYEENEYKCKNEKMEIDKDILEKGNKVYDREHMIFVPKRINNLFVKRNSKRGDCPIGVNYDENRNKFCSQCSIVDKNEKHKTINLGRYETKEEAFYVYKKFKENYIKRVADEYYQDDLIPEKLYWAMYRWEVNIDD